MHRAYLVRDLSDNDDRLGQSGNIQTCRKLGREPSENRSDLFDMFGFDSRSSTVCTLMPHALHWLMHNMFAGIRRPFWGVSQITCYATAEYCRYDDSTTVSNCTSSTDDGQWVSEPSRSGMHCARWMQISFALVYASLVQWLGQL